MSQNRLLFYLIAFISIIALISFSLSPFFEVKNFVYNGLNVLVEEEISSIIETYNNANLLFLDHRNIEKELVKLPYIKSVEIEKKYPDSIIINIKEREPLARIKNNGQFLSFTSSGFIVESTPGNLRVLVPEIKGFGYSLDNNYINFSSILNELVQALKELNKNTRSMIGTILYKEDSITATFNKIPIYLGSSSQLKEKFRILQSITNKIKEEDLKVEYIDLTLFKKPVIKLN